jgi:hypothetical protein
MKGLKGLQHLSDLDCGVSSGKCLQFNKGGDVDISFLLQPREILFKEEELRTSGLGLGKKMAWCLPQRIIPRRDSSG